jgi:DNA-binding NtrC family response regulator
MPDTEPERSLIFVVEDQALLRMEAVFLLEEAGFRTIDAGNADAALEVMRARWREVRVLFTDVQMPGEIDGVDLAEEVHRCWPHVLLLVTSGGVELRNEDLPDDGRFMPKPYKASTLISQVRAVIAQGHTH